MKESTPIYAMYDGNNFMAIMWETELGKILTTQGNLNLNNNLRIRNISDGEDIDNVDLRNVLMSVLPK